MEYTYLGGKKLEMKYWDLVDVRMSKESLSKVFRALILCHGHFTCSLANGIEKVPIDKQQHCMVHLRICLPDTYEDKFYELSNYKPRTIPKIVVN